MTSPSDGRITSLPTFTGTVADTDLLVLVSPGNSAQGINYQLPVSTLAASMGGGTTFVNAADFGVKGDGFTDDSFALQAAIDHALQFHIGTVIIPDGFDCVVSRPIWMAPPGSYANVDPQTGGGFTAFQFSLALVGSEIDGNGQFYGVTIQAFGVDGNDVIDFNNGYPDYPVIVVGPGQGMRVAGLNILGGAGSLFQTTFSPYSIGIAISGGPGGASRTMIERVWVQNLRTAFKTGWNEDSLSDSNTFFKCAANFCYIGYDISRSQNYIDELISCSSGYCPIAVQSLFGKAVQIYGGNYSLAGGISLDFAISGTTSLSSVSTAAGNYLGEFTTTITFNPNDLFGFSKNGFTDDLTTPIYNAFALETAKFGVVPCEFVSFNAATNAVTLQLQVDWVFSQFGFDKDFTTTDLQAEIQACTILIGVQRAIAFRGSGMHVYGCHIENPNTVTCLLDNVTQFNSDRIASIENIFFNYSPTVDLSASNRKVQSVWPLVNVNSSGGARIVGGAFDHAIPYPPWLFNSRNGTDLWIETPELTSSNMQVAQNALAIDNGASTYMSPARGFGHFPVMCNRALINWSDASAHGVPWGWARAGRGQTAFFGYVPASGTTPELLPSQYTILTATSPLIVDKGTYPLPLGQTAYRIANWQTGGNTSGIAIVQSSHEFYSYGQDMAINWSYKGQSNCVYMDDIGWMFQGLKIGLDNGGGTQWYIITGLYPSDTSGDPRPGYVTVVKAVNSQGPTLLVGTKTVTYTGATVYQEVYAFSTISGDLGSVAVSGLPTPSSALKNVRAVVTNATATTFLSTVAATGAFTVPVFCDGSAWKIG